MEFAALQRDLAELEQQGLLRVCRRIDAIQGGKVLVGGDWKVNLASNNYLGMTEHPKVRREAQEAIARFGTGAGSSRLMGGTFPFHEALEEEIARFKGSEAALVFPAGYMAGIGIVTALVGAGDLVIGDRLNHASLIDACRLSGAAFRLYPHADAGRLEEALQARRGRYRRALVVTEGLFSLDGDIAPLPQIVESARRHDCWVLLDDAHATGVLGPSGRGTLEHFGITPEGILQMGTLSKALGSAGGFLAAPRVVVEYLKNRARSFIYTTALPAASAAAACAALKVLEEEPLWRRRLLENTRRWISGLREIGVDLLSEMSPIVPIRAGSNHETMRLAEQLLEEGVYAPGIRPPTVPEGSARIRTSLSALHTAEDLANALNAFRRVMSQRDAH